MNTPKIVGFLFLLSLLIGFCGCKRVRPNAPVAENFEPPITEPVSYVAGKLTFNIRDLEQKVNKGLSTTLVSEETFEGSKGEAWRLRVERTGPVQIKYANRRVYLRLRYKSGIRIPLVCGKAKPEESSIMCLIR